MRRWGNSRPARLSPSPRPYPRHSRSPWYDATHQVRRVKTTGMIKWQGEQVFISDAVSGEPVGSAETERGIGRSVSARRTGADRPTNTALYPDVAWAATAGALPTR